MSYVKQPAETKLIAEGGKLMGEILEKLAAMVKPGITGLDIDNEAERLILAAGGVPA
ncbi:MAG: type I methionyl aminopeptidase, partial [Patescibacteria group bacterium]